MVALCNRADHYSFALWFLSYIKHSSLIWSGNSAASNMCSDLGSYISRESYRRREMYCGHPRLWVYLSAAACLHYCTDLDVTWESGRGCPLVVHYWADLQSGHGLRCYDNITQILVTSLRPSRDMHDDIVRTAGWARSACAAGGWRRRSQNCAPYMGSGRGWLAGDWPLTGGVLNITAAVWTAGFHWWRSGNNKRMQNVSEYMLVLALCGCICCCVRCYIL